MITDQHQAKNREQYNGGIDNNTRILTTLNPLTTHPNMAHRLQHRSHSTPKTMETYGGNNANDG